MVRRLNLCNFHGRSSSIVRNSQRHVQRSLSGDETFILRQMCCFSLTSPLAFQIEKKVFCRTFMDPGEFINGKFYSTNVASGKMKEYEGRKLIGFSPEQMYNVVADVENYRKFVPFCKKSEILSRNKDLLRASLVIGFPPFNESYVSKVTMIRPQIVKAECTDGKLFNHLNTLWIFSPGLKNNIQTCVIDFSLSFEFKSAFHSHLSNLFFKEIVRQMENAFENEARRRYGRPKIKTVRLER